MTEDETDAGGEIDTRQQAASLMQWLSFYAAQPQEHCITTVHGLLQTAFPNVIIASKKTEDDWGDVVATLESFYEASLAIDTVRLSTVVDASDKALRVVLELVLGAVVQCETKAIFVRDILTMDDSVHLGRELELIGKKLCDVEMEKGMLLETIQQLKEQLDVDVLRKERLLRALYDEQIQTLQCELDAAKVELRDKTVLASEVPALRDEVDLLRPLAEKMAKVDLTVAKYKAKIDDLSGAKDSLRRVENTNSELVEKNLALETELIKAASWQRKLKEAKEANTVVVSMPYKLNLLTLKLIYFFLPFTIATGISRV
ncbi:hypothetical protein BBJ29_007146 [Phytophthora kernoviae]|uniref:Hook C-terminal domain-containing protein n=1 Tax=Phytophthora kernoviae TaxID=325452 RepID=A0A3F2RTR3_9STRA|nr:hypothetical protein BBJ29_007146 [Phytophthora kernoviae]RLN63268.1 hypothetical protein BBP00_00004264 [Phytophthora kernoviae]